MGYSFCVGCIYLVVKHTLRDTRFGGGGGGGGGGDGDGDDDNDNDNDDDDDDDDDLLIGDQQYVIMMIVIFDKFHN